MTVFSYVALDKKGENKKGIIEADSERNARQLLREKGLTPLTIKLPREKKTLLTQGIQRRRMNAKELALITRQLATLFSAGLPIEEVLTTLTEQTEKPHSKTLMLSVRSKVLEGHALTTAMREFPEAFSELYCSTVAAGEKSGHLDTVLNSLADYTEQQATMHKKIQHALIYPAVMILVSVGIVGFLLEYVVPRMVTVYSNTGQTLPLMTRLLISFSTNVQTFGIYFFALIVTLIYFFRHSLRNNITFKKTIHLKLLKLPMIGNTIKVANTARFSRTFAILSSAGVSVLDAISIASQLITNLIIRDSVQEAAKRVREGASIYLALKQTNYFPPMSIHLIASGEASGQLENMLERAANNQDNEITTLIETSLSLLEPIIILFMGAIVLFIVLAVLLPIFQLDQFT